MADFMQWINLTGQNLYHGKYKIFDALQVFLKKVTVQIWDTVFNKKFDGEYSTPTIGDG